MAVFSSGNLMTQWTIRVRLESVNFHNDAVFFYAQFINTQVILIRQKKSG